ncbi:MAG: class I adenylate-forming enzyme family protein [Pseudomonadota bacterium]
MTDKLNTPVHNRITDYVTEYANKTPQQAALVFCDQQISYKELNKKIEECSKALLNLGVVKGDRIAMLCTPGTEFYVVFLATVGLGAIWIGLNPKYSLDEYRYAIEDARPKLLFTVGKTECRDYTKDVLMLYQENDFLEHLIAIYSSINGAINYSIFLESSISVQDVIYIKATQSVVSEDPALIVYTSGTTGRPKGAVLSHYGLSFGAKVQSQHFNISEPSIICNMPINHVACIADICCTTLVVGGTIHFQESFNPNLMLKTIEDEKIKIWAGVPTMFLFQLNVQNYKDFDLSSVQIILWGGSAMPEQCIKELQKTGARLKVLYGMTETSAHTIYSADNARLEDLRDSIGFPDKQMPCRIVNEKGVNCIPGELGKLGEQGEIQFKGNYLMLGYFNKPEATKLAFTEDGWFKTGDVARWREDGSITLVGRMSDMYKSGGYNVYPREIEIFLESIPMVDISVIISIPDPIFQEVGIAFMTLKNDSNLTDEDIKGLCQKSLANYKIPKRFYIIKKMPMLPIGKIDKAQLKKEALTNINLGDKS